jgi:AbiV family abortive infection protein
MWLKEARLIAKHRSRCHAQALTIFAYEEVGKAFMCWLVVNGVMPFNHPEVDFTNRRSIFKQHSLKSSTTAAILTAARRYQKKEGEDLKMRFDRIGDAATQTRSTYMYADIKKGRKGIEVINPLMLPTAIEAALNEVAFAIQEFKMFMKLEPEIEYIFDRGRKEAEEYDENWPEEPEWD